MTYLRALRKQESSNLAKDDIDDLLILKQDRDSLPDGVFRYDGTSSPRESNSKVPYKLISYKLRIWTSEPCMVWSSEYGSLEMVDLGGHSDDTNIIAENFANGVIKKHTLTDRGRSWSVLEHKFCGSYKDKSGRWKKWGKPRYMKDNKFKIQVQNLCPNTATADSSYWAIIEYHLDYDAVST